jgi:hypothetical protein
MRFEFKSAKNGLIMTVTDDFGDKTQYTYTDPVDTMVWDDPRQEISRFHEFLCIIRDAYGPQTSRYSKERIVISVEPGDKYEESSDN